MRSLVSTDSNNDGDDKDEYCNDKENQRRVKRKKNDCLGDDSSSGNSNRNNPINISSSAFPPLNFAVKCKL